VLIDYSFLPPVKLPPTVQLTRVTSIDLWAECFSYYTETEYYERKYSKTCLKRNAIVPVFFSVFTVFRFTKGWVLIKQSTKNMIA